MENKEFYYKGLPIGFFKKDFYPKEKGEYEYAPYLGDAHQEMLDELKEKNVARCYYDHSKGRLFFNILACKDNAQLEVDHFELVRLADKYLVTWLEPWVPAVAGLEKELEKEVGMGHPLFQMSCVSIGRRIDNDEVLFHIKDANKYAVVHLTWSGKREKDSRFPITELYAELDMWAEMKMKKDHIAYLEI